MDATKQIKCPICDHKVMSVGARCPSELGADEWILEALCPKHIRESIQHAYHRGFQQGAAFLNIAMARGHSYERFDEAAYRFRYPMNGKPLKDEFLGNLVMAFLEGRRR